jgi:hypothetical protein
MVTVLAGPVGEKGGAPTWPLQAGDGENDEQVLARLAGQLNLNGKQYDAFVDITRKVLEFPLVKRTAANIESLLGMRMTLDERMLRDLYKSAYKTVTEEARTLTPDELEDAAEREEHQQRMKELRERADEQYQSDLLRMKSLRVADEVMQTTGGSLRTATFPTTFRTA